MMDRNSFDELLGAIRNEKEDSLAKLSKEFDTLGGKRYNGIGTAVVAETWWVSCEEAFEKMNLTSLQKRDIATQHLDGAALFWWRAIKPNLVLATFTWENFVERFRSKFLPRADLAQLCESFINLKQGPLTVTQFAAKFNELSRYAPHMVDTQAKTVERFIDTLNPYLSRDCTFAMDRTLDEVIDIALRFERKSNALRDEKKRKVENSYNPRGGMRGGFRAAPYPPPSRYHHVPLRENEDRPPVHAPRQPGPVFVAAAPVAPLEAIAAPPPVQDPAPRRPIEERMCYRCGEIGHFVRNCDQPRNVGRGGGRGGGRGRGRVFMAVQGPNDVEGTLTLKPIV